jgi:DNA-binding transcriptional ArsR family regulator
VLNWERLARAAMPPIRVDILDQLRAGEASPRQMADRLREPLGNVSYHVRQLRDAGLIELTRTQPRRGAVEHFYVLADGVGAASDGAGAQPH